MQTSSMDCGPASLKSLLEGFGRSVSYGRLREACQTDVDGTSIDTIEELAKQLGLEAEQVMVPVDHVLLDDAETLPGIIVVRLPIGFTHFVVAWRTLAGRVQVMDPASGRRWPTREAFAREIYVHETAVPADAWREYASSDTFLVPLRARMRRVASGGATGRLVDVALADPGWRSLASLDAATRMVDALVESGGVRRGKEALGVLEEIFDALRSGRATTDLVPASYWFARPTDASDDGEEQVLLRGAVLVQARERSEEASAEAPAVLSPELVAALEEPPPRPLRDLFRTLREDGVFAPTSVALALLVATVGTVLEAVLLRALFDIGRNLDVTERRLAAIGVLVVFLAALVLLEGPIAWGTLRMGRHLEGRFRMAFLRKIPRLEDRYFQSRPVSDMAERSHSVHALRGLPVLGVQILRAGFLVVLTTLGIVWLDPRSGPLAALVAVLSVALPLGLQRALTERDLRVRSHAGALSRIYLDALLGLVSVRTHGAERSVRREHESLLVEWIDASRARDRLAMATEAAQSVLAFGLTGWLFVSYFLRVGEPAAALLLLYWAFTLPMHGQALALMLRQVPIQRNTALRITEPLGAIEQDVAPPTPSATPSDARAARGASVRFSGVSVRAGGHTILEAIDLEIASGSHVAIVGPSGAGKSSLVGLLLGWHRPASGEIVVDGDALSGPKLDALRKETAWIDPAVQLWNRSLIDNLVYGADDGAAGRVGEIVEQADLHTLLETLPNGLATELGEGGGLVSGGEGQRVRFGRGALRKDARLVVLDEPFRGLDRERRRTLLARARRWWSDATLLCITHDVGETRGFSRVIVIEGGRVVADGAPDALAADAESRYAQMLAAEDEVREGLWGGAAWRRLLLRDGRVEEARRAEAAARAATLLEEEAPP